MKAHKYLLNLKSSCSQKSNCCCLLAINKKEALKFCEDFDGLKVIDRIGTIETSSFDTSDELMSKQKEMLEKYIQKKYMIIEKEIENE